MSFPIPLQAVDIEGLFDHIKRITMPSNDCSSLCRSLGALGGLGKKLPSTLIVILFTLVFLVVCVAVPNVLWPVRVMPDKTVPPIHPLILIKHHRPGIHESWGE